MTSTGSWPRVAPRSIETRSCAPVAGASSSECSLRRSSSRSWAPLSPSCNGAAPSGRPRSPRSNSKRPSCRPTIADEQRKRPTQAASAEDAVAEAPPPRHARRQAASRTRLRPGAAPGGRGTTPRRLPGDTQQPARGDPAQPRRHRCHPQRDRGVHRPRTHAGRHDPGGERGRGTVHPEQLRRGDPRAERFHRPAATCVSSAVSPDGRLAVMSSTEGDLARSTSSTRRRGGGRCIHVAGDSRVRRHACRSALTAGTSPQ